MTYTNVFADADTATWTHRYHAELYVTSLTGGTPTDQRVIEGWLRAKLQTSDVALEEAIATTMAERGISRDDAIDEHINVAHLNGFKRVDDHVIIEGRQAKAAIKEAFNVANAGGHFDTKKWGTTGKGLMGFIAEHVIVPDRYIPVLQDDGTPWTTPTVNQRFVHTHRGSAIQYEETVDPAVLRFEVWSDWDFDKQWPTVWSIGGKQGIGATRSQGCGTYFVSQWDRR